MVKRKSKKPVGAEKLNNRQKVVNRLVIDILKKDVDSRDDDSVLMLRVWDAQGILPSTRFTSFGRKIEDREIALPKTIWRARQQLQAKYVELRGEKYAERHNEEVEEKETSQISMF